MGRGEGGSRQKAQGTAKGLFDEQTLAGLKRILSCLQPVSAGSTTLFKAWYAPAASDTLSKLTKAYPKGPMRAGKTAASARGPNLEKTLLTDRSVAVALMLPSQTLLEGVLDPSHSPALLPCKSPESTCPSKSLYGCRRYSLILLCYFSKIQQAMMGPGQSMVQFKV